MTTFVMYAAAIISVAIVILVKCRARVPFVTQESLFVNENLIL